MSDQPKGRGWHGNSEGHKKAGKKGGTITSERHGTEFYKKIGRAGGKSRAEKKKKLN